MKQLLFLLGLAAFLSMGCNSEEDQKMADDELIQAYITDNNLDAITDEGDNGLYYVITQEGLNDEKPISTSNVTVKYTGYFLDGTVFDSYTDFDGVSFNLSQVIEGWTIGIPKLTKGGKGTLLIPSHLGYGSAGAGSSIPGNSVLVFDVELLDFQ